METVFVKLYVDLHCDWEGIPPDYRIYVDDEMFTERTYRWSDPVYLTEILQIESDIEKTHHVKLEKFGPQIASFKFVDARVGYCDNLVRIIELGDNEFTFKVLHEN